MLFPSIYLTTQPLYLTVSPNGCRELDKARRGTVLLIVLVVLSIFASVGLAFVLYADSEAKSSSGFREAGDLRGPDVDPEMAFAMFLQQLIFGCKDDGSGVYSSLRGHDMLRNMYGLRYDFVNGTSGPIKLAGSPRPFNGTGRLHYQHPAGTVLNGADDWSLPHYGYFSEDNFLRDPEQIGIRVAKPQLPPLAQPRGGYFGGLNAPYTAPDLNSMFLAAVTAEGNVLQPSFHRGWTGFATGSLDLDPNNPNWMSPDKTMKYRLLRPRPFEHPSKNGKPGFGPPADKGGDVRNRPTLWAGSFNDSIWLYTGAPIFTLPDGRRYTALFAPLIVDLDGKLNISVAGNVRGPGDTHVSYSGWGATEINVGTVLSFKDNNGKAEWPNLFLGARLGGGRPARVPGKLAPPPLNNPNDPTTRGGPMTSPLGPGVSGPHFYGQIEFDAIGATGWSLPKSNENWPRAQMWPTYGNYGNAGAAELAYHPLGFNVTNLPVGARVFPAAELYKLYRHGDTNSDAMLGDLWQLLPNNFNNPADPVGSLRRRNMVTPLSNDRPEPGLSPWQYKPTTPNSYALPPSGVLPYTKPGAPPLGSATVGSANLGREYGGDGRGVLPPLPPRPDNVGILANTLARLDVNRPLTPYGISSSGVLVDKGRFVLAQKDRQKLAGDIFTLLFKVTGAYDPFTHGTPGISAATVGEIDALRYLAQLAVNIVDYIDSDDIITPFNWPSFFENVSYDVTKVNGYNNAKALQGTFASRADRWVYGTELPKVVINEAYCEYGNDPTDPGVVQKKAVATRYFVDIWAELCNPYKSDPTLPEGGDARLFYGSGAKGYAAYRLLVTDKNAGLRKADNTDGHPDGQTTIGQITPAMLTAPNSKIKGYLADEFSSQPVLGRLDGAFAAPSNLGAAKGFYVVGPADTTGSMVPFPLNGKAPNAPNATLNAKAMRFTYSIVSGGEPTADPTLGNGPTLLLQRLLCPYLPPDANPPTPTQPNPYYNPYITVDYFEDVTLNPNANPNASGSSNSTVPDIRYSVGRIQPYAKAIQKMNIAPTQGAFPKQTFFFHNFRADTAAISWPPPPSPNTYPAFDWLVHLDRNVISPMELLHVSAYHPHELTQQFNGKTMGGYLDLAGKMVGHQAPWFDNHARLYRFFEFVQTRSLQAGYNSTVDPRIPGKVNINTLWDEEVFRAVCDSQPSVTSFDDFELGRIFQQIKNTRNPGSGNVPGPLDQYFFPLSAGVVPVGDPQYPAGSYPFGVGIGNTVLRAYNAADNADPSKPRLLEPPKLGTGAHPYQRFELLTKIYNNFTTRSNCFAVWVTVGFFEVNDVGPDGRIYLGQEISRSEGSNIRHKMFAIVDRSELGVNVPWPLIESVLNQTEPFNPHAAKFKSVVPFFAVVD